VTAAPRDNPPGTPWADIGVFGGSGFYSLFDACEEVAIDTPFGRPSAPLTVGDIGGRRVAFLPRHGRDHEFLPNQVPTKANMWSMRALGVERVIGPCAAGSLAPHVKPGDFVALDQLVDRTWGRPDTYYDQGDAHHVSFADPYCDELRRCATDAARRCAIEMHEQGTVVVIGGPRFATRAESRTYRSQGYDVINMTQYPEAYLARELGICYCGIALITDYDTGVDDDPTITPVTQDEVFAFFDDNLHKVRQLLAEMVPAIPGVRGAACICAEAVGPLAH
jgi:5'-methylthioadenosine phosphorylase